MQWDNLREMSNSVFCEKIREKKKTQKKKHQFVDYMAQRVVEVNP